MVFVFEFISYGGRRMKIRQIRGQNILTASARQRLESAVFRSDENARRELQQAFPNHIVVNEPGRFSVFVRDRSFQVAQFETIRDGYTPFPRLSGTRN